MRKYIVSVITTVDGAFEGPGGDVMAMPFDDGFSRYNAELLRDAAAVVHGSRWYDGGAYWTRVLMDEQEPAIEREIARLNVGLDRLVISDSLQPDPSWPWAGRTRIVPVADGPAEVARLKQGDGGTILSFGSATTWNPLLEAGLVDELHVLVGPALLGDGTRVYRGGRRSLRLLDARRLEDSQLVRPMPLPAGIRRLLRFAAGSSVGLMIDLGGFALLHALGLPPWLANGTSSFTAVTAVYLIVTRYSFGARHRVRTYVAFVAWYSFMIVLFSTLIQLAASWSGGGAFLWKLASVPFTFTANYCFSLVLFGRRPGIVPAPLAAVPTTGQADG